jgi:copper resistance protein C
MTRWSALSVYGTPIWWRAAEPAAVILLSANSVVLAHGLAGQRFFPATILTDDPFVADEISLPQVTINPPGPDGSRATDIQIDLTKRITPDIGVTIGNQWQRLKPAAVTGFGPLETEAQYQLCINGPHEAIGAALPAHAHAFLDHASPAVGSSVPASPPAVTLWFTEDLEPAFSDVTVTNDGGQRVDLGNSQIPQDSPSELQIGLKPLPPGTYTVSWHVVSVDTHPTEGTFTFEVGSG